MIKVLRIFDLILVENADICFKKGFNVLSGETGSGKSAIMAAISLALGFRADTGYLRQGKERGAVEAVFDFPEDPLFFELMEQSGIAFEPQEELIVRREIASSGKSRAFVNNQLVTAAFLRKIGNYLVKFVGQHAGQELQSVEFHRDVLDRFGKCSAAPFASFYQQLGLLKRKLGTLAESEGERMRELETLRWQLEEIIEIDPQPSEDEDLFQEYQLLTNSEEFGGKCREISRALGGRQAAIENLNLLKKPFEQLLEIDPSMEETYKLFEQSILELQEISCELSRAEARCEYNPERLAKVSERLASIHQLKKKYGPSIEDVHNYKKQLEQRLEELDTADWQIQSIEKEIAKQQAECSRLAFLLTAQREEAAKFMEKSLQQHLRSLNMPKVEFRIGITKQDRTQFGDDRVEFFFRPNTGENEISVTDSASGGELSRIMLSLQVLLAGKDRIPAIIFDEIDANIGGRTAKAVGEKLKAIGKSHQVLCITHFPQVAEQAAHHFQISKEEIAGRTLTIVQSLDSSSRSAELERMRGGSLHQAQTV